MPDDIPAMDLSAPRILACGDSAINVEFGDTVDAWLNARVRALDVALHAAAPQGVVETVPTYRSLLVHFDPLLVDLPALIAIISDLGIQLPPKTERVRRWRVPVVYGAEFGEDIADLSRLHGLTQAELIARHVGAVYRVYMIGFMPGFAYLGGLDPRLATPRRTQPRPRIPAQSISIGGAQTAISTVEGPSGWHLIGRTPVRGFMRGRDPVFLYDAGDEVVFEPVESAKWAEMDAMAERGEPVASWAFA